MSYLGQGLGLGREERFTATATAGQTTVTTGNDGRSIAYTPNYVDVYLNGSKQVNGSDITVTSGTSIVFASALTAGDVIDVVAPGYFQPADTVSRSLGGTFLGAVNLPSGGLNVGSGQLKVDSSGRVTMGSQPFFFGRCPSGTTKAAGWTNISNNFTDVVTNRGGHYNTSTGYFTCPVDGDYAVSVGGMIGTGGDGNRWGVSVMKNGADYQIYGGQLSDSDSPSPMSTVIVPCAANDTLRAILMYSPVALTFGGGGFYSWAMQVRLVG